MFDYLPDWLTAIITAIVASVTTFVFARKKENVEIQGSEITNVQEAIKIWREMATDMKAEVAELKDKVESLTTEIHNLRAENVELRSKLGLDEDTKNK